MNPLESLPELSVSEFIAIFNQVSENAFGGVVIVGELANFRVSKNRWVYFDLKDEESIVSFFGSVYQLPGPLEDGMMLKVRGTPRHHNLYGFKISFSSITPAGEGSIKKAAELLMAKLAKEGLFDEHRKRMLPYPPQKIALVTSKQSAAYADFIKIINARWQGLKIELIDVQVQGERAPGQIVSAIEQFNSEADLAEVLIVIRGGGSAEDLAAFSTEQVTRAIASSRIPTLVAIGHEIDLSLAEMAADAQASTPSNAAEILVPDKKASLTHLKQQLSHLESFGSKIVKDARTHNENVKSQLTTHISEKVLALKQSIKANKELLTALNPEQILKRGYALVWHNKQLIKDARNVPAGSELNITLYKGNVRARTMEGKEI